MKNLYLILIILFAFIFIKCTVENNNIAVEGCPDPNSICEVKIGNQVWMCKNLDVARYRNGDTIRHCKSYSEWIDANSKEEGAWCYFENDSLTGIIYGKLYNWYAVNDPRGLAPIGWHIPDDNDWYVLINFLGGDYIAGGKMKSTGTLEGGDGLWLAPNTGATNESGFSALPGGYSFTSGGFSDLGESTWFWSATQSSASEANEFFLVFGSQSISECPFSKAFGEAVRCVKD
jgi:uncharacterized protein (TIGR02145 family)